MFIWNFFFSKSYYFFFKKKYETDFSNEYLNPINTVLNPRYPVPSQNFSAVPTLKNMKRLRNSYTVSYRHIFNPPKVVRRNITL